MILNEYVAQGCIGDKVYLVTRQRLYSTLLDDLACPAAITQLKEMGVIRSTLKLLKIAVRFRRAVVATCRSGRILA